MKHLSSASYPRDSKDVCCGSGSTCALVAVDPKGGIDSCPVCVDLIRVLSGNVTETCLFEQIFCNVGSIVGDR